MVSPKIWFLASWILVIALQSKWLPLLGAAYILAVFLYHYQRGVVAVAIATIIWYWIAATVALFVWQEFDIWLAGWVHIFIAVCAHHSYGHFALHQSRGRCGATQHLAQQVQQGQDP